MTPCEDEENTLNLRFVTRMKLPPVFRSTSVGGVTEFLTSASGSSNGIIDLIGGLVGEAAAIFASESWYGRRRGF